MYCGECYGRRSDMGVLTQLCRCSPVACPGLICSFPQGVCRLAAKYFDFQDADLYEAPRRLKLRSIIGKGKGRERDSEKKDETGRPVSWLVAFSRHDPPARRL